MHCLPGSILIIFLEKKLQNSRLSSGIQVKYRNNTDKFWFKIQRNTEYFHLKTEKKTYSTADKYKLYISKEPYIKNESKVDVELT